MAQTLDTPVTRYEAPQKVSGQTRYAADFMPAGMLHGALATSGVAAGRITAMDITAAQAEPGVIAVYTHQTLPKFKPPKAFGAGGPGTASFSPMTGAEIRYAGQPIAYVVADSAAAARRGAALVKATIATSAARIHMDAAQSELAKGEEMKVDKGDLQAGLRGAAATVDQTYTTPFEHHNPMELFATTAHWQGEHVTVWMPSQSVTTAQAGVVAAFGVAPTAVEVISPYIGGAFGSKAGLPPYALLTIAAARGVGAPVRLMATRRDMYTVATFRPESAQKFRLAASRDGKLTAFEHIEIAQTSRFDDVVNPGTHMTRSMYACPNIHTEQRIARSDTNSGGFMRAPNEMQTFFGLESAMDELAIALAMDPVELRRVNDTKTHPVKGVPFSSRSLMACYDDAAKSFGWSRRTAAPRSMVDGDWLVGYGCATSTYPTQVAPSSARVKMNGNGSARVELAAHDVGTGATTIMGQIAAQRLGLPVDAVEVVMGDSRLPVAPIAGGSVTSASAGSAVHVACLALGAEVARQLAAMKDSPLAGADPSKVRLVDGMLVMADGKRMPLVDAVKATPRGQVEVEGNYAHPELTPEKLKKTYMGGFGVAGPVTKTHAMFAFGAQFVEVRINRWT
ncbi:MAG: xanthine dehydrogenase family protein molybdopterin-binding subunit, partial [Rubrivivax sp.]